MIRNFRLLCVVLFALPLFAEPRWYKGNTHTHTNLSDGDAPPAEVVRWYRENGYDFLVITDHDMVTVAEDEKLLLIPGEEVTDSFRPAAQGNVQARRKAIHLNAIGISRVVKPQHGESIVSTLQRDVDAIREAGGIAAINHPNFVWSFTAAEMKQVSGFTLLEIASGHPLVHMQGSADVPSAEAMWDELLRAGKRVFAIAVDDAHHYDGETRIVDAKDAKPVHYAKPGRGWIVVRAEALTQKDILDAIARGDFYASTGVTLDAIDFDGKDLRVQVREEGDFRYRTTYVKTRTYVRARVDDSGGRSAWTQPFFFRK